MNSEKQAVRVLAENLAQAVKKASSQGANTNNRSDIITASKVVGLPAALGSIMSSLESDAVSGDAIAQQTLDAIRHMAAGEFETITADSAQIGTLYATFADFIGMVADNISVGRIDAQEINTQLSNIISANIKVANIDVAKIVRLSTGSAFVHEGDFGKIYIDDLAVTDANIVNLAAGTILINNENGNLVELYVDEQGEVHTRPTSYNGNDIINSESLDGGRIIKNSITTDRLNASEIFAANGMIMNLIADNIDATRIRTGTLDASAVKVINLRASDIITEIIKSPDYEVVLSPFVYPTNDVYPASNIYPSNGDYVRRGFAIDIANGQIYGMISTQSIGAVAKSGDTMTGDLTLPHLNVQSGSRYTNIHFRDSNGVPRGLIWSDAQSGSIFFRSINPNVPSGQVGSIYTDYSLPASEKVSGSNPESVSYKIYSERDTIPVNHGGTGATSVTDAVKNLGLSMAFNGSDWTLATMYPDMSKVPVPGSVFLWLSPTSVGLLSGNAFSRWCTCVASRTNASEWRFLAFTNEGYIYNWSMSGWSSASATPTFGTVNRIAVQLTKTIPDITTDSNGNIPLGLSAASYHVLSAKSSSRIVTPWVSGDDNNWHARVTAVNGNATASTSVTVTVIYTLV